MTDEKEQHWQHWDSVTVLTKNKRQLKESGSLKSSLTNKNVKVEKKGGNRKLVVNLLNLTMLKKQVRLKLLVFLYLKKFNKVVLLKE